jgi:hypothetical protein
VEGSVLRSGNQVRITAQLIQASADKHIWAQSYEGEIRDTLVLQNLARAGADLAGVVTFHAALNTPRPEDAKISWGRFSSCMVLTIRLHLMPRCSLSRKRCAMQTLTGS